MNIAVIPTDHWFTCPHRRSFLLWMEIDTKIHNMDSMQRVTEFGALSRKWNVIMKCLSSRNRNLWEKKKKAWKAQRLWVTQTAFGVFWLSRVDACMKSQRAWTRPAQMLATQSPCGKGAVDRVPKLATRFFFSTDSYWENKNQSLMEECHRVYQSHLEFGRGSRVSWSYHNRWLWVTKHGYWRLNVGPWKSGKCS